MKIVKLASLIIILGVFAACTPQAAMLPTTTFTITNTIPPSITPSLTPVFTWTPLPTLSDANAEEQLLKWLDGTSDCRFPCWAGITPGDTTWQEAKQILEKVVYLETIQENVRCDFGPCNYVAWSSRTSWDLHGSIFSHSNGTVYGYNLEGYPPMPVYRLDRILTQYGPPEKAFIETICPVLDANNVHFSLILVYPNHNFFIQYNLKGMLIGDNIHGYFTPEQYISLVTTQIDGEWTADAIYTLLHGEQDMPPNFFQLLEGVTDMTIDIFYEKFRNIDESEYIVTPCQAWIP